jgi:hypothetical protein
MRTFLAALIICACAPAFARDDGRYANNPLHAWFDKLASKKGLCCSFADGESIQDVDWESSCAPRNGDNIADLECQYRVRLHGEWIDVPESALVTEPNKYGPAVVWPYLSVDGTTQIRCFLPGAGA